jgi:Cu(I)/Ag(I) efflux system membrane fusion protein
MYPGTRFDRPGKSPFMDMDLVPRYAEESGGAGIAIDPVQLQNLGVRTEKAETGRLVFSRDFPADVNFNSYMTARIQPRAGGFVSGTAKLAVGDRVAAGDLIAAVTVPEWASDQSEYLLLKNQGAGRSIVQGVREKMRLSGMPDEMLSAVDGTGKVQTQLEVRTPVDGVVTELDVYQGMNVEKSMTLAVVRGTDPVWVTAWVPERDLHLASGRARLSLPAYPDRAFEILELTVLPKADPTTRAVPVRLSVANPEGLLIPGMTARLRLRATDSEAVLIPTQSLIDLGGDDKRVVTRTPDGSFLPRRVRVGRSSRDRTQVLQGLEPGEEVVTVGLFLIDSEANLRGALERLKGGKDEPEDAGSADTADAQDASNASVTALDVTNPLAATRATDATNPLAAAVATDATNPLAANRATDATDPLAANRATDATNPLAAAVATDATNHLAAAVATDATNPLAAAVAADETIPLAATHATDATNPLTANRATNATNPLAPANATDATNPLAAANVTDATNPLAVADATDTANPLAATDASNATSSLAAADAMDATKPLAVASATDATNPQGTAHARNAVRMAASPEPTDTAANG